MEKEIISMLGEMKKDIHTLHQGLLEVKGEMHQGLSEVKGEMHQGFSEVRNEMQEGFSEVRNEMHQGFAAVNKRIDIVEKNLSDTFSAIRGGFIEQDSRFEALDKKIEEMKIPETKLNFITDKLYKLEEEIYVLKHRS